MVHSRHRAGRTLWPLIFLALLIMSGLVESRPVARAADGCTTFSETGFKICGRFLEYWYIHGGLAQQGLPISAEFDERNAPPPAGDGQIHKVQYFERARFELHPENQPPYDVLLGLLGAEQFKGKYNGVVPPNLTTPYLHGSCQNFSETDQTVCGQFLQYWDNHGGLAQQGLPISPLFIEQNAPPPAGDGQRHIVQYFERARFELHDENQAPYDVLLGLLGTEQLKAKTSGPRVMYNGLHWSNPGSTESGKVYRAGQEFSAALVLALLDNGNDWKNQISWIKANTHRTGDIVIRLYWPQHSLPKDPEELAGQFYNQLIRPAVTQYGVHNFQVLNELNFEYEKDYSRADLAVYMGKLAAKIKSMAAGDKVGPVYLGFPGPGGDSRLGAADISNPLTNLAAWQAYWNAYATVITANYDWLAVHTYEVSGPLLQTKLVAQYDNLAAHFPYTTQRYTEYGGPVSYWQHNYQSRANDLSAALKVFKAHVENQLSGPNVESVFYYIANPSNDPDFELVQNGDLGPAITLAATF